MLHDIPCPIHGHPADGLTPKLRAWVDFYNVVAPYSKQARLDHTLISKLCLDYGLNFSKAFEMLTTIHKAVLDASKDKGVSGSGAEDEATERAFHGAERESLQ